MKNIISIATFIILSFTGVSQEISYNSNANTYKSEVYQENESLTLEIEKLKLKLNEANKTILKSSRIISKLRLELRTQAKDFLLVKNKFQKNIKSMESRFNGLKTNRFGFGASFGTTLDSELSLKPYLGIGLTFNLIVF